jgi:bifunctional UDP-N-acetylglucosamine pyrophosphorylase/glucosamine-1-phosphate N-acetyltransferase
MKNQIIILAAGHGKRMQSDIPKALTPLFGRPFLSYVLGSVSESGVCADPIIVIGQKGDQVRDFLGESYKYVIQDQQLGTGHAVMCAKESCVDASNIMILYSDQPLVSSDTIKNLMDEHIQKQNILTMATVSVSDFNDWRAGFSNFSRVIRDSDGRILRTVEMKDASDEQKLIMEINPCYLVFNSRWMWERLSSLKNDNAQQEYYLTDLIAMACSEGVNISTIDIDPKEALGVNTKDQLEQMENLLK